MHVQIIFDGQSVCEVIDLLLVGPWILPEKVVPRQEIQLRRTTPRTMAAAGRLSGLLMQAFRHLGREHITPKRMAHLKRTLPEKERKQLIKDIPLAPTWMHPFFHELAETES